MNRGPWIIRIMTVFLLAAASRATGLMTLADRDVPYIEPSCGSCTGVWTSARAETERTNLSARLPAWVSLWFPDPNVIPKPQELSQAIEVSGYLEFFGNHKVIGVDLDDSRVVRAVDGYGHRIRLEPYVRGSQWPGYSKVGYMTVRPFMKSLPQLEDAQATAHPSSGSGANADEPSGQSDPNAGALRRVSLPLDFKIRLDLDPNQETPFQLSLLECYVYALCAESFLRVDLPLRASDQWTEPVPGLKMRMTEVSSTPNSIYRFRTERRGGNHWVNWLECFPEDREQGSTYPAPVLRLPYTSVRTSDGQHWQEAPAMPDYVLVDTEFLDEHGRVIAISPACWDWYETRNDRLEEMTHMSGAFRNWFTAAVPAKIRHTFAVHPREVKIPIVFHDILIPRQGPAPVHP